MPEPIVNSYDDKFLEAFGRGMDLLPEDKSKVIKDMVNKIHEEVISQIEYYVSDDLKRSIDGDIRDTAASVARSMVMNAIAGDDKTIRNLFGFNDWYMRHAWNFDDLPTQWALIDALVTRAPDVFVDERIKQRDAEIAQLRQNVGRLNEANQRLRDIAAPYI